MRSVARLRGKRRRGGDAPSLVSFAVLFHVRNLKIKQQAARVAAGGLWMQISKFEQYEY